jgi:TolA-binding protein
MIPTSWAFRVACVAAIVAGPLVALGQSAADAPATRREGRGGGGYAALQLFRKGQELLDAGEHDRGRKILETIVEQYPADPIRFKARLALGRHALARSEQVEAIAHLRALKPLDQPGKELDPEARDMLLESLYLQGVAYFQTRQYAQAFPLLRRITNEFPDTVWANQSYYIIGMCHFAQGNWTKAIEALGLVGTFVEEGGAAADFVEAGRRFYVKIEDADLPVLARLGQGATVTAAATSGDSETVPLVSLPGGGNAWIGSVATALGAAVPGDGVLQVVGGDSITTAYVDGNTRTGQKDVVRRRAVRVAGTATLAFTRGDFESPALAAFQGQPVFVVLTDADLDVSPAADTATVRLVTRFKEEAEEPEDASRGVDIERLLRSEEEAWQTRDEITLTLRELPPAGRDPAPGDAAQPPTPAAAGVHTGRFGGTFTLAAWAEGQPVDRADATLAAAVGDQVVASFIDQLHVGGTAPRTATATTVVAHGIDSRPRAVQYEVADPVVAAKKSLVEATAFLELGRIFKSMGLEKGAADKAGEGLARVEPIVRQAGAIPASLTEEAFRTKWDLHIVADDYEAAIRTCEMFNRLYPDSPFVDRALLQIGRIKEDKKEPVEAIKVYQRILSLQASEVKAEAQFRIAQATEKLGTPAAAEQAVVHYKACADRYPDSPFAGESLAKLVDYHIAQKDNAAANELLQQIVEDHADAPFLDSMLLKWVMVAYRAGDLRKAQEKCQQLIFEYPASPFAERARTILPKIEQQLDPGAGPAAADAAAGGG